MQANPWDNLPHKPPFVLPDDEAVITEFNAVWTGTDYELQTHLVPIPFLGAHDAPVVLLQANPGYDCVNDKDNQSHPTFIDTVRACLRHKSLEFPFFLLDLELEASGRKFSGKAAGYAYWSKRLRVLVEEFGAKHLARSLLCIQFHPYRSKAFRNLPKELPSQEYSFDLVRAAMRRNANIVIMRKRQLWFDHVEGLEDYPRLLVTRNARSAYITSGNLPDGGFESVRLALQSFSRCV